MKSKLTIITSLAAFSMAALFIQSAEAVPAKQHAKAAATTKSKELPTILTGYPTNITVQVLKCVRANVPEFGRNNVVVLQYRLKKIGPNIGQIKYFDDSRFQALEIKARDASLGSSFEPIRGAGHEESTYSEDVDTATWKAGQNGDGYAWFKIPEHVTTLDVFFPKTKPVRLEIEVPTAK